MTRKSNKDQRRQEIVSALQRTMAAHGYEKATIQAIAKEADLAPGLIHYHFKNKQEILVELIKTVAEYGESRLTECMAAANSAEEKLNAFIQARLGLGPGADPNVVSAWVIIGAEAVRQVEVKEVYEQVIKTELDRLTELIRPCLPKNENLDSKARTIASGLLALIAGAFTLSSSTRDILPAGYAMDSAKNYINGAITSL